METIANALQPIANAYIAAQVEFIMANFDADTQRKWAHETKSYELDKQCRELVRTLCDQYNAEQKQSAQPRFLPQHVFAQKSALGFFRTPEADALFKTIKKHKAEMNPEGAQYLLAEKVYFTNKNQGLEAATAVATKFAQREWMKHERTIAKNVTRKGVSVNELVRSEVTAKPGRAFELYVEDVNGKSAHARSIIAWGEVQRPHMRFICT